MKKSDYLQIQDVKSFTEWLAKIMNNEEPITFINVHGAAYKFIANAFKSYAWPEKKNNNIQNIESELLPLKAKANFAENSKILEKIQSGLRNALTDASYASYATSTMQWGGVTGGNNDWIIENTLDIIERSKEVCEFLNTNDDDVAAWMKGSNYQNGNLRFNAGFTKVYSLLQDNFVIYDSRVAGALAWLVMIWDSSNEPAKVNKDHCLAFGCLPAKEGPNAKFNKIRNPDSSIFKQINNPRQHLHWNIRASWVLEESIKLAGEKSQHLGIRDIEAALFMIGYDLSGARFVSSAENCFSTLSNNGGEGIPPSIEVMQTTMKKITKKEKAGQIFNKNPGLNRQSMIKKFIDEAQLTVSGASTYFNNFNTNKW